MEQFAPSLAVTCPAHGGPDHVRRVSAVYREQPTLTLAGPIRLLLSARRLAWAGTVCGMLGAVAAWVRAAAGGGAASGPLLVAAAVCFGYAIACYGLAAARRTGASRAGAFLMRRRPGDGPGPPDRTEPGVWYCERCNAVFTEKAA